MRVFRVDHATERDKNGEPYFCGPYCNPVRVNEVADAHNAAACTNHPGIFWDVEEIPNDLYRAYLICGFEYESQIGTWFDGFIDLLHERNFMASTYEVPEEHVYFGEYQVAFNYHKAELIERRPLVNETSQ